ncbi:MAG: type II toxin-antitoxin system PemK/MazF family toxin [Methylococcaceae bacterium]
MTYERFEVVKVPFPFTDKDTAKTRPALVISSHEFNLSVGKTVMAMITSTTKNVWLLDTTITDLKGAGLPIACSIRMKLFTIDNELVIKRLGRLSADDCVEFEKNFGQLNSK